MPGYERPQNIPPLPADLIGKVSQGDIASTASDLYARYIELRQAAAAIEEEFEKRVDRDMVALGFDLRTEPD